MLDSPATLLLTKVAPAFVYPLGLTSMLLLVAGLCTVLGRRGAAASLMLAALATIWVSSTPAFADWVMSTLERQYPERTMAETPEADVAIVLGGAVSDAVPPRVELDLGDAADRVLHAFRLFRAGKVKRILVTGGNLPWQPKAKPEAELIRDLLVEWGVPAAAIEIAGASRNTYENALEIKAMRARAAFDKSLLVTSASHMPRSMAIFRKAGLPVTASSTDVLVTERGPWNLLRWLPDAGAQSITTLAIKEWLGLIAYSLRGHA